MTTSNDAIFEVEALQQRLFGWHGKTVRVVGYPMLAMTSGFVGTELRLHAESDKSDRDAPLVVCKMQENDYTRVKRGQAVVMQGRIAPSIEGHVVLEGCTYADKAAALPEARASLEPGALDAETLVRADQLRDAARGLVGSEVRVRGWYNGWTTSQLQHRTVHRIDLHDASSGNKGVSAELVSAPPEGLGVPDRLHVVRGRLSGAWFDNVLLSDAEIVESDV